jgi:hypothetical protein
VADNEVIRLRVRLDVGNPGNAYRFGSLLTDAFNLQTCQDKSLSQVVEGQFDRNELTKPVQGNFHLKLP